MKKYPYRITRAKAEHLFNKGESFVITPCNCPAYALHGIGAHMRYGLAPFACLVIPSQMDEYDKNFKRFVNAFTFYNCNSITGYYPAFYELREDLDSEI